MLGAVAQIAADAESWCRRHEMVESFLAGDFVAFEIVTQMVRRLEERQSKVDPFVHPDPLSRVGYPQKPFEPALGAAIVALPPIEREPIPHIDYCGLPLALLSSVGK